MVKEIMAVILVSAMALTGCQPRRLASDRRPLWGYECGKY
jgi:hypothetical protein